MLRLYSRTLLASSVSLALDIGKDWIYTNFMDKLKFAIFALVLMSGLVGARKRECLKDLKAHGLLNLQYARVEGVDPKLLSLDLYIPRRKFPCDLRPLVVWVHGGAWARGDKANNVKFKVKLFRDSLGYVFASVNYRLSRKNDYGKPGHIQFPTHVLDVAAALRWLIDRGPSLGIDTTKIALIGHSAGAHIVAILGTDERILRARGLTLRYIKCVASLDTRAYDLPKAIQKTRRFFYFNAFGNNPELWKEASPLYHVEPGKHIPPFLLVRRGSRLSKQICDEFRSKLEKAGVPVTVINADGITHRKVNLLVGAPGDTLVTPKLVKFLSKYLGED